MPDASREELRCPTCGAPQAGTDRCRRCKCDLRLLRAALDFYEQNRRLCLQSIRAGDPQTALLHASSCHRLEPGSESRRLLALSHLIAENWQSALDQAESIESQ